MFNYEQIVDMLISHPVFSGLDKKTLSKIIKDKRCSTLSFSDNESISGAYLSPALYFILNGKVLVFRKGLGSPVLLQKLTSGRLFGAASLFSDGSSVTELVSEGSSDVLLIPKEIITELIRSEPEFAMSYTMFLSEKIRFLNKRLSELSAPSIEQKLASFLLSNGGSAIQNRSQLASALGIGRASLYRVLDELESKGFITIKSKEIIINDKIGLSKLV